MKSLLVVDLSTSAETAGARIAPLVKYFKRRWGLSLLINRVARKTYSRLIDLKSDGITTIIFPFSGFLGGGSFLVGWEYLKRVLISLFVKIKNKPEVIYSLTGIICDVFPSFVFKKKTGAVWVANLDNIERSPSIKPGSYLTNFFSFLLFRCSLFFLKYADVVFVTTPLREIRTVLVQGGVNSERIILSDNGIPLEEIEKVREDKKIYGGAFLGRIHRGKGVFDLVEIWKRVLDLFPQAGKLVLIGSGDRETILKLKELIKKKNLDQKIVLVGFVSEEKKYELLKKSKLFLYPSYYDANPISTVEAMACGLPIIVYGLPIFIEHYPRGLVELVPKGNVKIFSQKVAEILTNRKKREKMSGLGVKWTRGVSWKRIFERQEKIILKTLMEKE